MLLNKGLNENLKTVILIILLLLVIINLLTKIKQKK